MCKFLNVSYLSIIKLLSLILFFISFNNVYAATTTKDFQISASLATLVVVKEVQDMDFGTLQVPNLLRGGDVLLGLDGIIHAGSSGVIDLGGSRLGIISITGAPNTSVWLSINNTLFSNGSNTLDAILVLSSRSFVLNASGTSRVSVYGTINIPARTIGGLYTATYTISTIF